MSHTPGPWSIHETKGNGGNISDRVEIAGPEEGRRKHLVASIYGFKLPEGQANARLIAAAPELYGALVDLIGFLFHGKKDRQTILRATAALAKARGEEGEEDA